MPLFGIQIPPGFSVNGIGSQRNSPAVIFHVPSMRETVVPVTACVVLKASRVPPYAASPMSSGTATGVEPPDPLVVKPVTSVIGNSSSCASVSSVV